MQKKSKLKKLFRHLRSNFYLYFVCIILLGLGLFITYCALDIHMCKSEDTKEFDIVIDEILVSKSIGHYDSSTIFIVSSNGDVYYIRKGFYRKNKDILIPGAAISIAADYGTLIWNKPLKLTDVPTIAAISHNGNELFSVENENARRTIDKVFLLVIGVPVLLWGLNDLVFLTPLYDYYNYWRYGIPLPKRKRKKKKSKRELQ